MRNTADIFIKGWAKSRGMSGSSLLTLGPFQHLHYGQPFGTPPLSDEFFGWSEDSEMLISLIETHHPALRHWLTIFHYSTEMKLAPYEARGYSLSAVEYLMARSLDSPLFKSDQTDQVLVQRVETSIEADWFNAARGTQAVNRTKLLDPAVHFYYIEIDELIIARGRAILVDERSVVIDDLFIHPEHRRRGLATTITRQMLTDAFEAGARQTILSASRDGRQLYKKLGYQDVALMSIFVSKQ